MKRFLILLVIIIGINFQLQAQSLYMPRNVKAAFEKGTRSLDGMPGPHYWQNRSNYNIDSIFLDTGLWADANEQDNIWEAGKE